MNTTLRNSSQGLAFLVYQQDMQECKDSHNTRQDPEFNTISAMCWSKQEIQSLSLQQKLLLHSKCERLQHRKSLGGLGAKVRETAVLNLNLKHRSRWFSITLQEADKILKNLPNASTQYLNCYRLNCVPSQIHILKT